MKSGIRVVSIGEQVILSFEDRALSDDQVSPYGLRNNRPRRIMDVKVTWVLGGAWSPEVAFLLETDDDEKAAHGEEFWEVYYRVMPVGKEDQT